MMEFISNILLFLNKKHQLLINNETEFIMNNCANIAYRENLEQKHSEKFHNNNCPKCHGNEDSIVNKILHVHGKITVTKLSTFAFKKINSSTTIDTDEVNHCNMCGNEWKKFKIKSVTKLQILKLSLNYLAQIINNPQETEREWKTDTIKVFNGCHAETIHKLCNVNKSSLDKNTISTLSLKKLKVRYKSIF